MMKKAKTRRIKRIGIIIITTLFIYCVISITATKLIYDGIFSRYEEDTHTVAPELEQTVKMCTVHSFPSGENQLTGYLYRAVEEVGLVVLAPGFHACARDYLWQIKSLNEYGWSVFAFDPTGTCSSEGDRAIGFPQELLDLEAALKYVESCGRFGYNDIMLLGHSRGGYAACCALSYDYDISAVVSISGIDSAMDGVMGAAEDKIGKIAYGNYGFLWLYQAYLFGRDTLNLSAAEAISGCEVPVLVIHGSQDQQVPVDRYSILSHKEEITSRQVEYSVYPAGHTDILFDAKGGANSALMKQIHEFFAKSVA